MNLLIHSHYFAPSVGGVESVVLSLASGISEFRTLNGDREFHVTVVTETAAGSYDDRRLPFRTVRRPGFFQLLQLVRESDIIHAAGPALLPMFLAWTLRKRFVVEHHGYQAICPNGILLYQPDRSICPGYFQSGRYGECFKCLQSEIPSGWAAAKRLLLMFPRNWLSRAASLNLAITNHVKDRHKLRRTSVVYYGIEDPLPSRIASVPSQKLCIAYVGRLVPEKGVPVLLEAAKILKAEGREFEVRLIGDGGERSKLENIIHTEELESCTTITGFLTGHAFASALQDVNVVVMPSMWEETAGLAAIEQMMRGRVVIAADIGGLTEVLGDTGLKFPPGNAVSLADCLRSLIENPALMGSYGQKARSRALQFFQRSKMLTEHAQIYRHDHQSEVQARESSPAR
jgi:glycosyltransferase involved in cell wall biosynthesis